MKSKILENLLAHETGRHSEMVTRFQLLRDSNLLSKARGRNAEYLSADEIVSGILSTVARKPGFAAMTAIGLRKLKPVGAQKDAFAGAATLAVALAAAISDEALCGTVSEVRLGDSTSDDRMATSAAIDYIAGSVKRTTQYVPATAHSLFQRGKEKEFDRRSLRPSIGQETFITARFLGRIARDFKDAEHFKAQDDAAAQERIWKASTTRIFPENFNLLHQGEEFLRGKSLEVIKTSDTLLHHFEMVADSVDMIQYFAQQYHHRSEDQLVIQLLGIRLFNDAGTAVNNMLSGYYQSSVMIQRDLLEVSFLLDYLKSNPKLIAEWKASSESDRNKKFSAIEIRKLLDDRDGFTKRKRAEHYKLLCSLGAHASYLGFQLLQPVSGGDAHCGPFFAETALTATVGELAKVAVLAAGNFTMFFSPDSIPDLEVKLRFMEKQSLWFDRFVGKGFDLGQIDQMRAILTRARAIKGAT
jgi:hypothetical protein